MAYLCTSADELLTCRKVTTVQKASKLSDVARMQSEVAATFHPRVCSKGIAMLAFVDIATLPRGPLGATGALPRLIRKAAGIIRRARRSADSRRTCGMLQWVINPSGEIIIRESFATCFTRSKAFGQYLREGGLQQRESVGRHDSCMRRTHYNSSMCVLWRGVWSLAACLGSVTFEDGEPSQDELNLDSRDPYHATDTL